MAKELPYFKFEPNQWENGNIQMCSRENKGLFIDLCSMYWSRLGDLPLKLAIQKLCGGNAVELNSLCDDKIIAVEKGFIRIDFLEEQLSEFDNTSKQNSKNAKDGWEKRRKQKEESENNATASNPQSESYAIREDKIIEEEKKEDKIIKSEIFNFKKQLLIYGFNENLVEDWLKVRKTKRASNTETAFNKFISELEKRNCNYNETLEIIVANSWSGFSWNWIDNLKNTNNGKQERSITDIAVDAYNSETAKNFRFNPKVNY